MAELTQGPVTVRRAPVLPVLLALGLALPLIPWEGDSAPCVDGKVPAPFFPGRRFAGFNTGSA